MSCRTLARFALVSCLCLLAWVPAHAQSFRAYLSATGSDSNPCSLPAPCRLLPAALTAVMSGGEIWMLDSANFNSGTVTITKSVTILAIPGAVGSVLAISGPAIGIVASGLNIALRNLVIAPFPGGGGTNGIELSGTSIVTIENSLISNLNDGVHVVGTGRVEVTNTIIRNNAGYAVSLQDGARAGISGAKMVNNGNGAVLAYSGNLSNTTANVTDSVISGPNYGVAAFAYSASSNSRIFLTRCTIYGTATALLTATGGAGTALIAVNNSSVTDNFTPWLMSNAGAVVRTMGNNQFTDNTNPGNGTLTPAAPQ